MLSRLYKAEDIQKKRTGSHQGNADFGSMLRGAPSSPAAGSPRTPRTLAVKPGSTKKKSAAKSPAGGGSAGGGRELAMATGERDRLKKRLQEVSAELELAKTEAKGASAAQEALLEARAELEVSRQEEERLTEAARAMEARLQAVLDAAAAQGVDLSGVDVGEDEDGEDDDDGVTTMEITCPEGVSAGEVITIETPDGDQIELEVPEGISPGDTFAVQVS